MDPKQLGDQPATPSTAMVEHIEVPIGSAGLTKREAIAKATLGHLAAVNERIGQEGGEYMPFAFVATRTIGYTDALLAELAREVQP